MISFPHVCCAALIGGALLTCPAPARADGEPEEAAEAPETAVRTDHASHVGRIALGFAGTRFVPATAPAPVDPVVITDDGDAVLTVDSDEVTVPLFGARYWLNRTVGIDLALGFNVTSGDETREIPNPDPSLGDRVERATPSTTAVAARLAVPLSVWDHAHLNILLMPELDIGYSSMVVQGLEESVSGEALDLQLTGFVFGVGGSVGAELSFGFIGVPELAVESAWGLRFESRRRRGKIGDAEVVRTEMAVGTSFYGDPWDVFLGSFALRYYL